MALEKTSVALGMFDGLHLGHIEVIKAAIFNNKYPCAVFTFNDNSLLPKMSKRENIITYEQKISLLKSIGVDEIYAPDFSDTKDLSPGEFVENILIQKLNAKYVTCGYDFHFGKNGGGTPFDLKKICSDYEIEVKIIPAVLYDNKPISSTEIRTLIVRGEIEKANLLLGYDLMYDLPVVHGAKIGRKISVPTINQIFPIGNVMPKFGVYKSWSSLEEHQYPSITNIGIRPTVNDNNIVMMETHIIGYKGNMEPGLYGKVVRISLIDFIRDEKKFDSIAELKTQIDKDIQDVITNI